MLKPKLIKTSEIAEAALLNDHNAEEDMQMDGGEEGTNNCKCIHRLVENAINLETTEEEFEGLSGKEALNKLISEMK